jgi:hypothetical protein
VVLSPRAIAAAAAAAAGVGAGDAKQPVVAASADDEKPAAATAADVGGARSPRRWGAPINPFAAFEYEAVRPVGGSRAAEDDEDQAGARHRRLSRGSNAGGDGRRSIGGAGSGADDVHPALPDAFSFASVRPPSRGGDRGRQSLSSQAQSQQLSELDEEFIKEERERTQGEAGWLHRVAS